MSRSAKAASSASEVSGEGGTGLGSGITKVISQLLADAPSRSGGRGAAAPPRSGAGGHLKGAPQTPTTRGRE